MQETPVVSDDEEQPRECEAPPAPSAASTSVAEFPTATDRDWEALDLREAGRFVHNEARAAQEEAWAGTNLDARQIWGAREAQRIYGKQLQGAVSDLLWLRSLAASMEQPQAMLQTLLPPHLTKIADFACGKGCCMDFINSWQKAPSHSGGLSVCVRKRPLLKFEATSGIQDAVTVIPKDMAVICHDGRLSRSGRHLQMTYRRFVLDRVWDASAPTEAIYQDVVEPLTKRALAGAGATILCMGQTGTGKTYTVRGVLKHLAAEIQSLDVSLEFVELYGEKCRDLLAARAEVHMRSDGSDRVHLCGQRRVVVPAGGDLLEILEEALKLRAAEETERNSASSRSHAICSLTLGASGGVLRLVDLAGSERNFETTRMTAAQHRESAGINASLTVLKDCFRAHAARQRGERALLPFRRSRLTRLLRDCFVDPAHRTLVIATVSPTALDVIHSVNTLRHATMLAKLLEEGASEFTFDIPLNLEGFGCYSDIPVDKWLPEHVQAWLREAENGRFSHVVVPPNLNGRTLLFSSPQALADLFEGELRRARASDEGEAWTVGADGGENLGRELFAAARRTALAQSRAPGR